MAGAVGRDGGYGQMARNARLTDPERNAEKNKCRGVFVVMPGSEMPEQKRI